MSRIIVSCILCVAAFCLQASDIIQVSAGTDVTVNGGKFSVGGANYNNTRSYVLDFAGNSTITVESGLVGFGIIATNGTVTLDLTKIGNAEFALNNGAVAKGGGRLVVKGRNSLCVGSKTITENNFAPPAGIVNVEYRNSDGNAYDNPEGLILVGRVLEWELPTASPWKMDASTVPCIVHNDSKIVQSMMTEDGTVSLENREMWIYEIEAFPTPETPVYVGSGSEMVVILRLVKPDEYFEQSGYNGCALTNSIEVAEGGVLNLRSHKFTLAGAVSGSGTIRYTETNLQDHWTKIEDATGFSGHISCEWPQTTLKIGNAVFGTDGVSMALCDGSVVELGTAAENGYSGTIRTLIGPETGSATLTLPPAKFGSVYIGSRSGNVSITGGAGYDKTTVTFGSIAVGELLAVDGGESVKYALDGNFAVRPDVFALERTNGRNVYLRSDSQDSVDFIGFDVPSTGDYKLVARNGISYKNVPENVNVTVPDGVEASVFAACSLKTSVRMEGGSVSVSRGEPDWQSKVVFWMDPSDMDSVVSTNTRDLSSITYPVISQLNDKRESQTDIKLKYYSSTVSTWPTLVTNGVNGLSYLSCDTGGNRRLWFGNSGVASKYAIMVFGSQMGGGQGIIGNISGYYARGGELSQSITKDSPIFASNITTYVNGELVNAKTRALSGGWEIISFDTSAAVVHGFGFNGNAGTSSNAKGQNYGEVLLFSETPTEEERIAAERYLAEKWGMGNDYNDVFGAPELRIDGNGSVALNADVSLSGSFAGTLDLNGYSIILSNEPLPPGEDAVSSAGLLAWFDPELSDTVDVNNGKVNFLYDRRGKNDGAPVLNGSGRTPLLVNSPRGLGSSRNWIDYSPANFYDEITKEGAQRGNYGRLMRLNRYPTLDSKTVPLDNARTVFVVQDSVKGGGTPFLSGVNGGGDLGIRLTQWPDMQPDPGTPVWSSAASAIFTEGTVGGTTYLDGREIDGAVEGFQGRPELLTAVGNRDFTLGVFAYYKYLQDFPDKVDAGEILGEIIVYDSVLGDDVRKQIEAYLMWKWLGVARDGYSVATNMTLTGNGSVTVASKSQMPKFGTAFTGAAAFEENVFDFTVNGDGSVSGVIDMGAAAISFPTECTANVSFADGMKTGTYTLVQGDSIASGTSWTLNIRNGGSRIATIVQNDGTVVLEVRGLGTVVTVR